ncbi:hypothetical protein KAM483_32210 [Aeromonas caviae]|nr:hypothetical protein KAM473_32380 [Aeromonas caviae]GKR54151.1 hypothetical protein KAM475_32980 [Aeromonas caviae]GKR62725.1 hypothetical protein KAM477_33470 [Aeromonas caviae]GKR88320.1 hypothetical protein KAM483_32210 [Aeromonas caviae]GKR92579.1 hypothetical protein KAM484_33840 [Aeromonas caviae]
MTYSQTLANHILDTLKKTLTDKGIRYQTLMYRTLSGKRINNTV